jgi:uncharacterized protein (TIGR02996 family)
VNEDEAFIRAIVDNPGDDVARLVYADWLDERDDPRGTYLRAEFEWAKPWRNGERPSDSPELRERAVGLDPVWVARISRPPVGICCEHMGFEKRRPPITRESLVAIERRFSVQLAAEYQAFLLNYNAVWSDSAYYRTESGYHYPLLYIFAVNTSDATPYKGPGDELGTQWQIQQLDLAWRLLQIERKASWPEWDSPHVQDFIPFLCKDEESDGESSWLLIGVRGKEIGRIATLGYDSQAGVDTTIPVAPSFAAFLCNLVPATTALPRFEGHRRLFEYE